jgi:ABC-type glutathione transport system ATPase component
MTDTPVLELRDITKRYAGPRKLFGPQPAPVTALNGVSLSIHRGETFGLLGESGSGKSTLARIALRFLAPSSGSVILQGQDISATSGTALRRLRRRMQLVPQNATGALDPRLTIRALLEEPLLIHALGDGPSRAAQIASMLDAVALSPSLLSRRPHQLSGGQRQRISLARALLLKPDLIILDEPVSALDVSVQAQTINLLRDLQRQFQLTYLFIGHDPIVAEYFCDRVGSLQRGQLRLSS